MIDLVHTVKVASCAPIATQRATFDDSGATNRATVNATISLKALAGVVIKRNIQRNDYATEAEKQRNFCNEKSTEKLRKVAFEDDRRFCRQCLNFSAGNRCMATSERQQDDIPRRCDKFRDNGKAAPLGRLEESAIRAWLEQIGETDKELIEETLQRCRDDVETRRYFLARAEEVEK